MDRLDGKKNGKYFGMPIAVLPGGAGPIPQAPYRSPMLMSGLRGREDPLAGTKVSLLAQFARVNGVTE